jgi:hypothetical protein
MVEVVVDAYVVPGCLKNLYIHALEQGDT